MLKKAAFSPAQPRSAKTRPVPGKAATPQLTLVSRLTFHVSLERRENDAGGLFQHPANETMPIRIRDQSDHVDIAEKSLHRHDNRSGICGLVLRNMPVSVLNSWLSNIGGCTQ